MSRSQVLNSRLRRFVVFALVLLLGFVVWQVMTKPTYGARLGARSLVLTNNTTSETSEYKLSFEPSTTGDVGSLDIKFCANDPLVNSVCDVPNGFDIDSATISSQSGATGFSISPTSTNNHLILTRTASNVNAGTNIVLNFTGVTNPDSQGTYYVRVQTFDNQTAFGPGTDYGGIAFSINNSLSVTATVPPFLVFCTGITITGLNCATANGSYIDFGELSPQKTGKGTSQMLIASNAVDGYNVTVLGTTLTSGNNIISALSNGDVSRPGTAQFGLNLRANSTPSVGSNPIGPGTTSPLSTYGQPNFYRFTSGDSIISNSSPDDVRQYTASYIVNVPSTQEPGIYVSTITYICLASF